MVYFILYFILFSVSSAASATLMGDKNMLSGNILSKEGILKLILNWKFYSAIFLAIFSKVSFVLMNSQLLKIDYTKDNATNITALVSIASIVFIFLFNFLFLNEWLTTKQFLGSIIILFGVWVILTR